MSYRSGKVKQRPGLTPGLSRHDFRVGNNMLSERIRYLRLCMGLTMEQLAQKAGVCRPTIDSVESGRGIGRLDILRRICMALDCKLNIVISPNRMPRLDHRVLRRDGRIARRPRVKTREEGRLLDELLGHLNVTVAHRAVHPRRYTGPSEMEVKRLQKLREEVDAGTGEPPAPTPPSI